MMCAHARHQNRLEFPERNSSPIRVRSAWTPHILSAGESQSLSKFQFVCPSCFTFLMPLCCSFAPCSSARFSNQIILPPWRSIKKKQQLHPSSYLYVLSSPLFVLACLDCKPRHEGKVCKRQTMTQLLDRLQTTMRQLSRRKLAS